MALVAFSSGPLDSSKTFGICLETLFICCLFTMRAVRSPSRALDILVILLMNLDCWTGKTANRWTLCQKSRTLVIGVLIIMQRDQALCALGPGILVLL